MRRRDREVLERAEILGIIEAADHCVLAMVNETGPELLPYAVALNYGFEPAPDESLTGIFWFHSAAHGRKLDVIRRNPNVCIELDCDHEPVVSPLACNWGMKYASVIATGRATIVEDARERERGLDCLMRHYMKQWRAPLAIASAAANTEGQLLGNYQPSVLDRTVVIRVDVATMTAKRKR